MAGRHAALAGLDYVETAVRVMLPFVAGCSEDEHASSAAPPMAVSAMTQ